jgi:hypothetical protein
MQGTIQALFTNLLTIGTAVGVTVAAFFLMWGGYLYMSAGGNPRQMERGKEAIVNALIGLAIVLAANTIAGMIRGAIG